MTVTEKIYLFQLEKHPLKDMEKAWLINNVRWLFHHERIHAMINSAFSQDSLIVYHVAAYTYDDVDVGGRYQSLSFLSLVKNIARSWFHCAFDLMHLPWSLYRFPTIWAGFFRQCFGTPAKDLKEMESYIQEEFDREIPFFYGNEKYTTTVFVLKRRFVPRNTEYDAWSWRE